MRAYKLWVFLLGLFLFLGIIGCGGGGSSSPTGTLSVGLTDAPLADEANVTGVYITVSEIEVHTSGSGWKTLDEFNTSVNPINLLQWQEGDVISLGDFTLPSGKYTQMRFMLDAPQEGTLPGPNPGCYIKFDDNSTEPLFVPSGSQTGYKAIGNYNVPINGTVTMTADFDVRKSVILAGGTYKLKPTIRLVVTDEAGKIKGTVSNLDVNSSYTIYSYEYDDANVSTWDVNEENEVAGVRFANALSSSTIHEDGNYTLAFLAEGTYDLVIAKYDDSGVYVTYYIETGIDVQSDTTTTFDWTL